MALSAFWTRRSVATEFALYVCGYLAYLFTRGLAHDDPRTVGISNGQAIASFQDNLGILWEPGWQSWAIEHIYPLVVFLNWAYLVTYWPVVLLLAVVLFVRDRGRYYRYRLVVVFNLIAALVIFMLFPAASPFAIPTIEVVDTIQAFGPRFYGTPEMAAYYNISAAMPSLHFSWTVILGVYFVSTLRGGAKALGLLYPVLTFFAIVITGNHFIVDAIAGGLLAAACFGLVELLRRTVWRPGERGRES